MASIAMACIGTAYTAMAYNSHGLISCGRLQDLCTSAQEELTLLAERLKAAEASIGGVPARLDSLQVWPV